MRKRVTAGTGALGALLALPAAAQAENFKVTNLNEDGAGSLRNAIEQANADPDADRILFNSKLSGTISTGGNQLSVNYPLQIRGPGARQLTVSAANDARVFNVATDFGADVTISGLRMRDGDVLGGSGGGLINVYADLTLSRVAIVGNTASNVGGGVFNFEGRLTVADSTVSGNTAESQAGNGGGGIYNSGGAELTVLNSTVSGNRVFEQDGGGVYNNDFGQMAIRNSTIVNNSAEDDGGGVYADGATELRATIVANNEAGSAAPDVLVGNSGPFDAAFSLIEDPQTDGDPLPAATNIIDQDPNLKPLANNGGPTNTHAFKKSPARNKVPKSESEKKDQRGAPRKGKGDIGAYELTKCEGVIVNRIGTAKKDTLKGTKRKDGILGLGGNDRLQGKKGRDGLCGGKGKDKLKGGPGKDKLDGGPGKDKEIQ